MNNGPHSAAYFRMLHCKVFRGRNLFTHLLIKNKTRLKKIRWKTYCLSLYLGGCLPQVARLYKICDSTLQTTKKPLIMQAKRTVPCSWTMWEWDDFELKRK